MTWCIVGCEDYGCFEFVGNSLAFRDVQWRLSTIEKNGSTGWNGWTGWNGSNGSNGSNEQDL